MDRIDDKYEVLEPLREGGMGAIYKVRHRLLDEVRVVKVMRPHASQDPALRRRFLREAKLAIKVRHANIGQLYDFSIDEAGTALIVMEFIDGVTLQDVLRSGPPPSLPFVVDIAAQVLQALSCLHFNGIVHRDVSSDNVMLTRSFDGRPLAKLIDLGIAKDPESDATATQSGTFLGKARYAAPEQFRGEQTAGPTPATDLYSFGVLLYELLTGRLPIEGQSFAELATGHLFEPPLPFEITDPAGRIPPGLRESILRVLEKDPARRMASAEAFEESIRPYGGPGHPDPAELEHLVERARAALPSGKMGGAVGAARLPRPRTASMEALLDAVLVPLADPGAMEILEAVHAYHPAELPAPVSAPRVASDVQTRPPPRPAEVPREPRLEMPAAEDDELEEEPENTFVLRPGRRNARRRPERRANRDRLGRRAAIAAMAVLGLLVIVVAALAIPRILPAPDSWTAQIEDVLQLGEETLEGLDHKLEKVTSLSSLLPDDHGRGEELRQEGDRLGNLREMHVNVGRLSNLLRGEYEETAEPAKIEKDAASIWGWLQDARSELAADDRTAERLESQGREMLLEIGNRTGSTRLSQMADEP